VQIDIKYLGGLRLKIFPLTRILITSCIINSSASFRTKNDENPLNVNKIFLYVHNRLFNANFEDKFKSTPNRYLKCKSVYLVA
jgi:hypothetical protein